MLKNVVHITPVEQWWINEQQSDSEVSLYKSVSFKVLHNIELTLSH